MHLPSKRYHTVVLIFLSVLLLTACSPKISNLATHNRYVKNFNTHIVNDSLQLHLITPSDITYVTDKRAIKSALKANSVQVKNKILVLGTTKAPAYQFLVTIGPNKENDHEQNFVIDTVINQQPMHFIGHYQNKAGELNVHADIKQLVNRLKTGKNYLDEMSSVMDIVNGAMKKNQFFKTLTEIQQFKIPKNQGNSLEMQMQLTYASFLGDNEVYKSLIQQQEQLFKPKDSILSVISNNKIGNDLAIAKITKLAKAINMVMINENHYYPNHRLFLLQLLPKLKEVGYTHLALEALDSTADSLLNQPLAYPKLTTGFYTMEQNYGNLLREAKKLGFQFVAYENIDTKKDRELGQVENLYNKTIGKDQNAKVLVIAGVDHILEQPTAKGKKWMATLMKEIYQIDPLTISQTHLNLYRSYSPFQYQLLAKEDFDAIKPMAAVDYFVLNNQYELAKLWNSTYKYHNKYNKVVQVNLFYKKEMKNDFDFQVNIPYFSTLLADKKPYLLPYHSNEKTLMVVYDQLGTVLEKTMIN